MASVRKREWTHNGETKTAWVCEYTDQTGKRRRKTFEKKKDADAYRSKVSVDIEQGKHVPDSQSKSIKATCEMFIKNSEQRVKENRLGRSRYGAFCHIADKYLIPFFGPRMINEITWADVDDWHAWMFKKGISPITAKQYLVVAKQIEDYARKRGVTKLSVFADYCREVRGVKSKIIKTFTVSDISTLLKAAEHRPRSYRPRANLYLRCVVNLAAFCGLRYGEIHGLTLDNIDLDARIIHIRHSLTKWDELKGPKTSSGRRDVPLPLHVGDLLKEWCESFYIPNERKLLFRTSVGNKPISAGSFHKWYWRRLLQRAGLQTSDEPDRYHFHALRHFTASYMIEMGLPLTDVAALLGHSKFDMTLQVYAHPVVGGHRRHETVERMVAGVALALTDTTRERQGPVSD